MWFIIKLALLLVSGLVILAAAISLMGGGELLVAWWNLLVALRAQAPEFLLWSLLVPVYVLPAAVALKLRHHNAQAIVALNLLLGWTFLGWAAALVWALTRSAPPAVPPAPTFGD